MTTHLRVCVAAVVVALACAACADGDGTDDAATGDTATEVIPSTTLVTTTTEPPTPFPAPEPAAQALIAAWEVGDRAGAARVASPNAVDALFTHTVDTAVNRGCQEPLGGKSDCTLMYRSGLMTVHVVEVDGGWLVDTVTVVTDQ